MVGVSALLKTRRVILLNWRFISIIRLLNLKMRRLLVITVYLKCNTKYLLILILNTLCMACVCCAGWKVLNPMMFVGMPVTKGPNKLPITISKEKMRRLLGRQAP